MTTEQVIEQIIDGHIDCIHFDRIVDQFINEQIWDHHEGDDA